MSVTQPHSDAEIAGWVRRLRSSYLRYLTTSFHFRDPQLRESFRTALEAEGTLVTEPVPEYGRYFRLGVEAPALAEAAFPGRAGALLPALHSGALYAHQEEAIRQSAFAQSNIAVASGTASGKTECFLYPILFSLYGEHLAGTLGDPGVRALVLYPMNALVNDQRERIGALCGNLAADRSDFRFSFGQYIGQTPENIRDRRRHGRARAESALPGETVFREDMRARPPHLLFTNYSMLEHLLLRPDDSPLFDAGRAAHWRFLVLDEAHMYRGARGIEMAMLLRRLTNRLRRGGRSGSFRCVATSATIASTHDADARASVARFASALFGEPFAPECVIFGQEDTTRARTSAHVRRYHVFARALEGAFLHHHHGQDRVTLNRGHVGDEAGKSAYIEIALCRECGQHYYVGRRTGGFLLEACRDPSREEFGVEFYLPAEEGSLLLCRICGALSDELTCRCGAAIRVERSENRQQPEYRDQLKRCAVCSYSRGGVGDPVQAIVHGADAPNAVLATAMHRFLPEDEKKILAFADSRQDAAFFAWYAEDSYRTLLTRNLLLRALRQKASPRGASHCELSVADLAQRLERVRSELGVHAPSETGAQRYRDAYAAVLREAVTDDTRLSLAGVGLCRWHVALPPGMNLPPVFQETPWRLNPAEASALLQLLLAEFLRNDAVELPSTDPDLPTWSVIKPERPQLAFSQDRPHGRRHLRQWGSPQGGLVRDYLPKLVNGETDPVFAAQDVMVRVWDHLVAQSRRSSSAALLSIDRRTNGFRLRAEWLRVRPASSSDLWRCRRCDRVTAIALRGLCPRPRCTGRLGRVKSTHEDNHYRRLYLASDLPADFRTAEHTAQLTPEEARSVQRDFQRDRVHLLSSSTTFEVGVDLGDLRLTFLRNVPPEPFNYTQRVGRAGRRGKAGLAVTYCRRNSHDLHYFRHQQEMISGRVRPPILRLTNPQIVQRHMTAVALSHFFRQPAHRIRAGRVKDFIGEDWRHPDVCDAFGEFCRNDDALPRVLHDVVPATLRESVGVDGQKWVRRLTGSESRLARAVADRCAEYLQIERILADLNATRTERRRRYRLEDRLNAMEREMAISFLARHAIIPKYGFPVDVVELQTGATKNGQNIELDRDLSLALAEYAPGSSVVADKLEWKSVGIRRVEGQAPTVRWYFWNEEGAFESSNDAEKEEGAQYSGRYLVPRWGFTTDLQTDPRPPVRRPRRQYTTKPFFQGYSAGARKAHKKRLFGLDVAEALPGRLVVLCEGQGQRNFLLCEDCGLHDANPRARGHKTADGRPCRGTFSSYALGHELVTDVVKVELPGRQKWVRYSLGYALLHGAADAVAVPERDLNVTLTVDGVVLYDDVPGGAGLVGQLTNRESFRLVLELARTRVRGDCGCDASCYGCLRSYRNQWLHPHLNRKFALNEIEQALSRG